MQMRGISYALLPWLAHDDYAILNPDKWCTICAEAEDSDLHTAVQRG